MSGSNGAAILSHVGAAVFGAGAVLVGVKYFNRKQFNDVDEYMDNECQQKNYQQPTVELLMPEIKALGTPHMGVYQYQRVDTNQSYQLVLYPSILRRSAATHFWMGNLKNQFHYHPGVAVIQSQEPVITQPHRQSQSQNQSSPNTVSQESEKQPTPALDAVTEWFGANQESSQSCNSAAIVPSSTTANLVAFQQSPLAANCDNGNVCNNEPLEKNEQRLQDHEQREKKQREQLPHSPILMLASMKENTDADKDKSNTSLEVEF